MDERISYEGIRNIYLSPNLSSFIQNISYGADLRYGRLFWNIDAITSYIPYLVWGDKGQIIATRLTEFLLLTGSFFLLTETFVKNNYLKLGTFCLMLFLPLTQYFINEPKPEPAQLFIFSLFLYYAIKNSWQIKPYIIFLGICFMLKISFIPISFFLIIIILYHNRQMLFLKKNLSAKSMALYFIVIGAAIVVLYVFLIDGKLNMLVGKKAFYYPKLQSRAALLKLFNNLEYFMHSYTLSARLLLVSGIACVISAIAVLILKYTRKNVLLLIIYILAGVIICTPCILFIPVNFTYLGYLIANNKLDHAGDDPLINPLSWIKFIFTDFLRVPSILLASFLIIIPVAFFRSFNKIPKQSRWHIALLFTIFFLTSAPIILNVHRLWGHYLFTGFIFLILLYFSVIQHETNKRFLLVFILLPLVILLFFIIQSHKKVGAYADRTDSETFKSSENEYLATIKIINSDNDSSKRIFWDPALFFPDKIVKTNTIIVFYELFDKWHEGADLVVLGKNINEYATTAALNTPERQVYLKAKHDFEIWTNPQNDSAFYYKSIAPELQRYHIFKKMRK